MAKVDLIQKVLKQKSELEKLPAPDFLRVILKTLGAQAVQANSLGAEDVVILHMLHGINPRFKSFTLDTGRLNPETYDLLARLTEKYGLDCEILFPDATEVEAMVKAKGINLFYESLENRKQCCEIRKVRPLSRVLAKYSAWICGLRREQTTTRTQIEKIEIDTAHGGMLKINPLADWTRDEIWDYIHQHAIPYNRLHDAGYPSIGCAPCTRAINPSEPERAGRWWWENPDSKECGLHKMPSKP